MITAEYTVQALAWLAVWTVAGLSVRQWLADHSPDDADREPRRHEPRS